MIFNHYSYNECCGTSTRQVLIVYIVVAKNLSFFFIRLKLTRQKKQHVIEKPEGTKPSVLKTLPWFKPYCDKVLTLQTPSINLK